MVSDDFEELNLYEKKFIEMYGSLFDEMGRSETQGKIFAYLLLRGNSEVNGLSQEDLAETVNRSVSTVSRVLGDMVKGGLCTVKEAINEKYRRENRYYISKGVYELTKQRTNHRLHEAQSMISHLESLNQEMDRDTEFRDDTLQIKIKEIISSYSIIVDLLNKFIDEMNAISSQK